MSYKIHSKSRFRSSFGSGVSVLSSLYDLHYANGNTNASGGGKYSGDGYAGMTVEDLNAERANSYDFGYESFLDSLDLNLDFAYFYVEQNPL